jgi:hypothetical protein
MPTDNSRRKYYLAVEEGRAKNDYTNAFLNHFGFCDYPKQESVTRDERKYRKEGGITLAGNSSER